jgi:hypothetical protein
MSLAVSDRRSATIPGVEQFGLGARRTLTGF